MNLYSVLLVDDEEEVYSVIMKKLDWEATVSYTHLTLPTNSRV